MLKFCVTEVDELNKSNQVRCVRVFILIASLISGWKKQCFLADLRDSDTTREAPGLSYTFAQTPSRTGHLQESCYSPQIQAQRQNGFQDYHYHFRCCFSKWKIS